MSRAAPLPARVRALLDYLADGPKPARSQQVMFRPPTLKYAEDRGLIRYEWTAAGRRMHLTDAGALARQPADEQARARLTAMAKGAFDNVVVNLRMDAAIDRAYQAQGGVSPFVRETTVGLLEQLLARWRDEELARAVPAARRRTRGRSTPNR